MTFDKNAKIVLGIDPGIVSLGYGIIYCQGNNIDKMTHGAFKVTQHTKNDKSRLGQIFGAIVEWIDQHSATEIAIEAPFFGVNAQSTLKLGKVLGVVYGAAFHRNIPVTEYLPRKVKLAITGNGNATKEQVARMVFTHLRIPFNLLEKTYDATDALAVAICHCLQYNSNTGLHNKKTNSVGRNNPWKSFIEHNPERIER